MMYQSSTWVLLTILLAASPSLAQQENESCNKTNLDTAIQDIRVHIKQLRSPEILTDTVLDKIEASFLIFVQKYERFMANCSVEEQEDLVAVVDFFENITSINQCVMSIVKGELEEAKKAIERVTDDQLMELMVTVYCANETDCKTMLDFAHDLNNTYARILIYQSLTHLLDNGRMNTTLNFINDLCDAKRVESNPDILKSMKRLLRQSIKADLTLVHDHIEDFYKTDTDLTFEVVQELIKDNFDGNILSYAIFQLIQRSPNATLWIRHLESIFHKLEERKEVNSVFGAELVREIKRIENLHQDLGVEDQEKLQGLKEAIPTFVEKLLLGEICCDMLIISNMVPEVSNDTKVFISSKFDDEFKRVKFIPVEDGPLVIADVKMEGSNMTLVMDHFEHKGEITWNNVTVPASNARIEVLKIDEFCRIKKYSQLVCMPARFILSTITKSPQGDSTLIEKFFEYYNNNKNSCSKKANLD